MIVLHQEHFKITLLEEFGDDEEQVSSLGVLFNERVNSLDEVLATDLFSIHLICKPVSADVNAFYLKPTVAIKLGHCHVGYVSVRLYGVRKLLHLLVDRHMSSLQRALCHCTLVLICPFESLGEASNVMDGIAITIVKCRLVLHSQLFVLPLETISIPLVNVLGPLNVVDLINIEFLNVYLNCLFVFIESDPFPST